MTIDLLRRTTDGQLIRYDDTLVRSWWGTGNPCVCPDDPVGIWPHKIYATLSGIAPVSSCFIYTYSTIAITVPSFAGTHELSVACDGSIDVVDFGEPQITQYYEWCSCTGNIIGGISGWVARLNITGFGSGSLQTYVGLWNTADMRFMQKSLFYGDLIEQKAQGACVCEPGSSWTIENQNDVRTDYDCNGDTSQPGPMWGNFIIGTAGTVTLTIGE